MNNMLLLSRKSRSHRHKEQGYVLITLMLAVTLMAIAALTALPDLIFELKRDQEQEMINRGVQYTRAIRTYYRKFGRYPTRLEDLENTNNLRYLRKRYKDPLTGKDFKLLHFGDPGLQLGGSFGGGVIPGATAAGAAMNGQSGSSFGGSSFGGSGSFGGSSSFSGGSSSFGGGSSFGNNGVNSNGVFSQSSSFGGNSNGFSGTSNSQNGSSAQTQGSNSNSTSDSTSGNTQVAGGTAQGDASSSGQQVFGGGPIVGVASISKKKTIREFNKKKKYDQWQFIYDPTADRGGLIRTPYQPPLQGMMANSLQNGQSGSQSGNSGSSFGNSGSSVGQSPFGQGSSFGNSSGFGNSGFGNSGSNNNSNPAPSNPPQ